MEKQDKFSQKMSKNIKFNKNIFHKYLHSAYTSLTLSVQQIASKIYLLMINMELLSRKMNKRNDNILYMHFTKG